MERAGAMSLHTRLAACPFCLVPPAPPPRTTVVSVQSYGGDSPFVLCRHVQADTPSCSSRRPLRFALREHRPAPEPLRLVRP